MTDAYDVSMAAVLFLSVIVQISYTPGHTLGFDNVQAVYIVHNFLANGTLPLHGIKNSQSVYNTPFTPWLAIPTMMMGFDQPWAITIPVLFLQCLAILMLYDLGRRHFNPRFGLAAAALYAFSTKGLEFGHTFWAQTLEVHVYFLMVYCLYRWIIEDKPLHLTLSVILAAVITGIHWIGTLTIPALAIIGLLFRDKLKLRPILVGVVIALILWLPYLYFECTKEFKDIIPVISSTYGSPRQYAEAVTSEAVTEICNKIRSNPRKQYGLMESVRDSIRPTLKSVHPLVYDSSSYVYSLTVGFIRTLYENFHWDEWRTLPGSLKQKALFVSETILFLVGLGVLLNRQLVLKNAGKHETLLLVCYFLPAVMLNITFFNALSRPDIIWLVYGPQIMIVAYAVSMLDWTKTRTARTMLWISLASLILVTTVDALRNLSQPEGGVANPQGELVSWIAEDLAGQGRRNASIRYDIIRDSQENVCWFFKSDALEPTAYIGNDFDYLLETVYGIANTEKRLDGWAPNPDYTVLFTRGAHNYNLTNGEYTAKYFGGYIVLKTIK